MPEKKNTRRSRAAKKRAPAPQAGNVPQAPGQVPAVPGDASASEMTAQQAGPPVVGIGASAGGLDAFTRLFAAMPADCGIAFVLIPHLDPTHESLMAELIARHTSMPVVEAADGLPAVANHVYVIPPNKYVTIAGGVLRLTGPVERSGPQTAIDLFLRSLAEDKKENAICIILSGTGAHGTLGLRAIKAAGGMAMVQDPATAEYPPMPRSAVATGLADYVLPVEQMPAALLQYIELSHTNGGSAGAEATEALPQLNEVVAVLRARTKLDFRCYRKRMLARRIERRMSLSHFASLADYLEFLRAHADEVERLRRDLLVSVTSFFRDPEAYRMLQSDAIAPLIRAKEPDAPVRVWSVGCATGEEAYSVGMVMLEQLAAAQKYCPVHIFATDVDEEALDVGRQGIYPEGISADVSPERLARFFVRTTESSYQVGRQLREIVTFARQNLITDAPFSKLDLIVCRNLLIYLEPDVQKRVIALLHFALNDGGYLFLGSSETIGRHNDLFDPVAARWRIYRRIGPARANDLQFPVLALEPRQMKQQPAGRPQAPPRLAEMAQNFLLRRLALACVVINRNYEVLHFAGPTEDYLVQPVGPPTQDLLSLARPGLDSKLRVVIQRAIRVNAAQSIKDVMMRYGGVVRRVNIDAEPLSLSKQTEGLLLIAFQEQPNPEGETLAQTKARTETAESDLVRQLEQELETTREDLQSTIEELESSNEELKASNEETMSMNEELQSTNEELETSKEELQSLNEELNTVNNQLQEKLNELETVNTDMANLWSATDIPTLFLDGASRIKRFTPAATRLFKLIATDVGRPISDISQRFADDQLLDDARSVLSDHVPREQEVHTDDDHWCLRRIVPYRTLDNRTDGVVVTFVDITERKRTADAVVRRLAAIVEASADAIFSKDLNGIVQTWNRGAERLYGYRRDEIVGRSVAALVPPDRTEEFAGIMDRIRRGESIEQVETERLRKDGGRMAVALTVSPIGDDGGAVVSASVIARDIGERKQAEQALRDREERLQAILGTIAEAVITMDQRGIIQSVNPATEQMFGYTADEMVGQSVNILMPIRHSQAHDGYLARYLQTGEKHVIGTTREVEAQRKDGTLFPTDLSVSEIAHLKLFTGVHRDLSARRQLEREVVEVASLEQRRIGQDLHDTVGQELTALNLLADELVESVLSDPAQLAALAARIREGLKRSQRELRIVLRGLLPVAVDSEGLMAALADLAERTAQDSKVACTFECPRPVSVADNLTATHLYLIAQEAVHNALKHGQPRTIRICLEANRHLELRVQDDGVGMPAGMGVAAVPRAAVTREHGLGLRIMRNRAALIGAQLTIESAEPTGTAVTCTLPRRPHEQEETPRARSDRR